MWSYELANLLKERENPVKMGVMLGKVESLNPLIISIKNGKYQIQQNRLYVCNQILERRTNYHDNQFSNNGNISISCHPCTGSYNASGTGTGSIHLEEVWQVGDLVMVVPDESEQNFFIVDIVRKTNGYNEQIK